jgi:photosystem II stability/assembly factor-like uncharacterized protein
MRILTSLFCLFFSVCLFPDASAQEEKLRTESSLLNGLRARQIGPAVMSGRVSSMAVHPNDPTIIYLGSAGGGVWKTVTGGTVLRPIFDEHTQSIGKVAIAPSAPETVYVGTGEPWPRNSVSVGTGIYKSTNGGSTWTDIGLDDSERISDIIVHPDDPNTVYVAALGHLWGANEERGVFKTTDGGESWTKVLYIDENTGATDLDFDPANPEIVYAVTWSFRRTAWSFDSGFTGGSGVYKSTNGGADWTPIQNGLPEEKLGRMAIGVAPTNGDIIYLSVECKSPKKKGLYLSTDAGANWKMVSNDFNTTVRPFYFSNLTVDPTNDSIVAKCGLNAIISEDRGHIFRTTDQAMHSDIHDIWIDPTNNKHILFATDGGIYESIDHGRTTKMWMNLPVSQFYHVSVDDAKPFNVYGGLQDNGSWVGPSRKAGGIGNNDWTNVYGGDGFYAFRHPTQEHIIFAEYQGGNLVRYNKNTGQAKSIAPYRSGDEEELRYNWNSPVHLSTLRPERMYFGSQYLFRSEDMGESWDRISPDLTTDDPEKQKQFASGGLSIDNSTAENNTTIYAIGESPVDESTIWVGTDDGNLQVTTDGGKNWTNVVANVPDLPAANWVTFVEPSPHDARTAYVTFDHHRAGDMTTYLYKTTDLGTTWTRLADVEDVEGYALTVRQDLVQPKLLFLGTEFGLYISLDDGESWARFTNNMPRTGVRDMVIHPRDPALVMATHGRGIILLDDLSPLRQLNADMLQEKVAFFEVAPTLLRDPGAGGNWFGGSGNFTAGNPSSAAQVIYYNQKRHTFGKMYFEIYKDGEKIKEIPAGKSGGINIVRMPTSLPQPKAAPTRNRNALFGSTFGPNLEAGEYEVKLIKGKDSYTSSFTLAYDPDAPYTEEERALQRKVTFQLYDMSEELAYVYHVYDQLQTQLSEITDLKKKRQMAVDRLAKDIRTTMSTLVALEGDFYVDEGEQIRERISNLYTKVSQYPGKPSDSQVEEADRLQQAMQQVNVQFARRLSGELAAINALLEKEDHEMVIYDSRDTFFATETEDSSNEGGQQNWKGNEMYRALNATPLGWRWSLLW